MFTLTQPNEALLCALIQQQRDGSFSYPAAGSTREGALPPGYNVDRNRVRLGSGRPVFLTAKRELQRWTMFDLGWVSTFPRETEIQPGAMVAVVVSHFGFWSVNLSRIVYIDDQQRSYSFAYGTLFEHAESGEEKFTVTWDHSDDSVWYELLAFSKPNHTLAKAGYPISRMLQKRFARDSMAAMAQRCRA